MGYEGCGGVTIAIHLARPTRIRPSRRPCLSGRKAHERPSWDRLGLMLYAGDWWEGYH